MKYALAIDPDYAGRIPKLVERLYPHYDKMKILETPDCVYHVYYWDNVYWAGSVDIEKDIATKALFQELGHTRHAWLRISDDGVVYQDNLIEDEFGVDQEIENILDWNAEILAFDEPLSGKIPYDRLFNILHDYLIFDMDAATTEYVRDDVLRNIAGCTDDEIKALGFGCILEV